MRHTRSTVIVAALALMVAACGGQSAEEELAERIIESSDGEISDVEVDTDDGEFNVSFEGDDGEEVNISGGGDDDDFEVTIEGDDGETMVIGGGDIPDELELPVPPGGDVQTSMTSGSEVLASLQYPDGDFDELVGFYDSELGSFERSETSFTSEDGTFRTVYWISEDNNSTVSVGDCIGLPGICVNLIQSSS